jgi:TPR repeat protein
LGLSVHEIGALITPETINGLQTIFGLTVLAVVVAIALIRTVLRPFRGQASGRLRRRAVWAGSAIVAVGALVVVLVAGTPDFSMDRWLEARPSMPEAPEGSAAWQTIRRDRARGGDDLAALQLGLWLLRQTPGTADGDREAVALLRQARLYRQASTGLGYAYELGRGVEKDATEARRFYTEGTGPEDPAMAVHVARMLRDGVGGPKDPAGALRLFRRAAAGNNADGIAGVGFAYLDGSGVAIERTKGLAWLNAAADSGQLEAMAALARAALDQRPADPRTAYRWLALLVRRAPPDHPGLAWAQATLTRVSADIAPSARAAIDATLDAWQPSAPRPPP